MNPASYITEQIAFFRESDAAPLLRRSRFLFIGERDFANCATNLASAMDVAARMVVDGLLDRCVEAGSIDGVLSEYNASGPPFTLPAVRQPHPFGYSHGVSGMVNGKLIDGPAFCDSTVGILQPMLADADILFVVTTGDSSDESYALQAQTISLVRHHWPLVTVYPATMHVGSKYRRNPDYFDGHDDEVVGSVLRFVSGDSMQHLTSSAYNVDDTLPYPHSAPIDALSDIRDVSDSCAAMAAGDVDRTVIVHSPSSKRTKGTDIVRAAVDLLRGDHLIDYREVSGLSFADCVEARKGGHIFVDQINAGVGGFGMSSVEAAGQGMVPLATIHKVSEAHYEACGLSVPPVRPVEPSARSLARTLAELCGNHKRLAVARWVAFRWAAMGGGSAVGVGTWALAQFMASIQAQGTQH